MQNYHDTQVHIPVAMDEVGTVDRVIFAVCDNLSSLDSDRQACTICPSITTGGCIDSTAAGPAIWYI